MPGDFVWHGHHQCELPIEYLPEGIAERRKYITRYKAAGERPLRRKLLKKVRGELPADVVKAATAYSKAERLPIKNVRGNILKFALRFNRRALLALHRKECPDCPWTPKHPTIF